MVKQNSTILSYDSKQNHPKMILAQLINKFKSRSLSELTRQITPRTKNGHAPLPDES